MTKYNDSNHTITKAFSGNVINGNIIISLPSDYELDLYEAKQIIQYTHSLVLKNKLTSYGVIIYCEDYIFITKEARDHLGKHHVKNKYGTAFIINNLGLLLIANVYVKTKMNNKNTKVFTAIDDAKIWLDKQKARFSLNN